MIFKSGDKVTIKTFETRPAGWVKAMEETMGMVGTVHRSYLNDNDECVLVDVNDTIWEYDPDQLVFLKIEEKNQISMDKQYRTSDKTELVNLLSINGAGEFPVVYEVLRVGLNPMTCRSDIYGKSTSGSRWDISEYNPYEEFQRNQQVMVRVGVSGNWVRRYFSRNDGDKAYCFADGQSSWTADSEVYWPFCRLPTEEELKCPEKYSLRPSV